MEAAYRNMASKANIPGFRKGKAPRSVVEGYMGKESILDEAIKHIVPQAYDEAILEQEIEPFGQPEIEVTQTDPVIFTATVPLAPTVELGDYAALRLEPEPPETTDENIEAVLEEMRRQNATWEPSEGAADYNDLVVIDVDSTVEDKSFIQKVGIQYQLMKDAVAPVPGFAEQLVGMKGGDEKEFKLSFPEDFSQKHYAGKEASFKVKVEEIKAEKLPELDDDFVKQVSTELKTMDELRDEVSKNLRERAEEKSRTDFEEKVVNTVIEQAKVEYPPALVGYETSRLINDSARQFQMSGRSIEDYMEATGKNLEALKEDFRPVAEKNVAGSIVLGKVAEEEKIEVAEDDINAEMEKNIESVTRQVPDDKKEEIRKAIDTPETRESIRRSLLTRRTIDRLAEIARGPAEEGKKAKEAK